MRDHGMDGTHDVTLCGEPETVPLKNIRKTENPHYNRHLVVVLLCCGIGVCVVVLLPFNLVNRGVFNMAKKRTAKKKTAKKKTKKKAAKKK